MEDLSKFQICFLGGLILFFFFPCKKEETKAAFYSDSHQIHRQISAQLLRLFCYTEQDSLAVHLSSSQQGLQLLPINTFLHIFIGKFYYDFIDILHIKSMKTDRKFQETIKGLMHSKFFFLAHFDRKGRIIIKLNIVIFRSTQGCITRKFHSLFEHKQYAKN